MNELLLYGTVGSSFWDEEYFTAQEVREALGTMSGPLTVRINSGGGIATEGQAIYTALREYEGEVTVIIDGIAASAASLIAMAGATIRMPLGAVMMIHDPASWYVNGRGTEDDHLQAAAGLRVLSSAYAAIYAARAGISKAAAREIMKAETYFDGPGAVEAGFATDTDDEVEAVPAAAFDYRLYGRAPAELQAAAGAIPRRQAHSVLAMMVGAVTTGRKENTMPNNRMAATTAAEEDDQREAMEEDEEETTSEETTEEDDPEAEQDEETEAEQGEDDPEASTGEEALAILAFCQRRGLGLAEARDFITRGLTARQAIDEVNDKEARMSRRPTRGARAQIQRDERATRREGMAGAIHAQLARRRDVTGPARQFMGMSLVEMAALCIGHTGPLRTAGDRQQVLMAASHSTSDFPAIFENALNKQLLERYQAAQPTYREVARQKNFRDFRPMPLVRVGDFPSLKPIGENGEIKWGTFGESREVAAISSFAIGLTFSRQMLINDDLGAIDELVSSYGETVARDEERMFYAFALSAVMSDGKAIFHADHGNLAAANAAIGAASVSLGRAAIRKQKSIDGNNLNLSPSILLVGPDKETEAEMLLAEITPTAASDVNPFSGRLRPVVTAEIAGNAWYLLSSQAPCWVYGFLEGAEAPRLRTEEPFGVQGFSMTLEHDFGFGAADYRGGYKNNGA